VTDERIAATLAQFDLADVARRYPRDLSSGERQRVALAALCVTQPQALLLDEPTRGLDHASRTRLIAYLRRMRDDGAGILLVTHDVELAAALADRVVLLGDGRILLDGAPTDLLANSPLFATQTARLFPGSGHLTPDTIA
jgi:energy-coupling factor transport system ATP-binding protein